MYRPAPDVILSEAKNPVSPVGSGFFVTSLVVLASVMLSCALPVASAPVSPPSGASGPWARLDAAVAAIKKEALPAFSHDAALAQAIKGYLSTIDIYSTYITPDDMLALKTSAARHFAGVGMDIIQNRDGIFFCLPYNDSPARRAGIRYGDILRSVDGAAASALPLRVLQQRIRGEAGKAVILGIAGTQGFYEVSVIRDNVHVSSVEVFAETPFTRIRIVRFDNETISQLTAALKKMESYASLVLDIRGNVGGDLEVAAQCAAFFLPLNTLVMTLYKKNSSPHAWIARTPPLFIGPLVIWQDAFTASSAEVFAAALRQNARARILGQRSFGKGVTQIVLPAQDGGLYIITNGLILPPNGKSFDNVGLEPDTVVVQRASHIQSDYEGSTYEAFGIVAP